MNNAVNHADTRIASLRIVCALILSTLALGSGQAGAEPPKLPVPAVDQSAVAQRGYFYVGGKYVGEPGKEIMQGQAYVEVLAPKDVRRPYPLVLIHGAAQTATNWMGTPDGRDGWADFFSRRATSSTWSINPRAAVRRGICTNGPLRIFVAQTVEQHFTAPEVNKLAAGEETHAVAGQGPEAKGRKATRSSMPFTPRRSRPSTPTWKRRP